MKLLFNILTIFLIGIVCCQRAAKRLKQDLFSNYDSQSRPVINPYVPTNICVGLYVLQIVEISERRQVKKS